MSFFVSEVGFNSSCDRDHAKKIIPIPERIQFHRCFQDEDLSLSLNAASSVAQPIRAAVPTKAGDCSLSSEYENLQTCTDHPPDWLEKMLGSELEVDSSELGEAAIFIAKTGNAEMMRKLLEFNPGRIPPPHRLAAATAAINNSDMQKRQQTREIVRMLRADGKIISSVLIAAVARNRRDIVQDWQEADLVAR
jgi:hypothetical protein